MPPGPDPDPSVPPRASTGQYFEARPTAPSAPRRVPLTLPDATVELVADAAIFSADRIDPGTKYLLMEAPSPPPAATNALDLGCGYGPIAVTLARRSPEATVWAVDVNERAVALCQANAERLGHTNVRTSMVAADQPFGTVPEDVRFDVIWSNPPIRIGKEAMHELLLQWLARLTPAGHAYLVVQKHLGADSLLRWLTERGFVVDRFGARSGYRILHITPGAP